MKYTIDIHVDRLKQMLERIESGQEQNNVCPAAEDFSAESDPSYLWKYTLCGEEDHPCMICSSFVGIDSLGKCPCLYYKYSDIDVIALTKEKIKEYENKEVN